MASKIPNSVLKTFTRQYAVKPAPKLVPSPAGVMQLSRTESGVTIVSLENKSPITSIGVFLRGGSRYDTHPGMSHVMQVCATAGLGSNYRTGFNLIRVQQQIGTNLAVTHDREVAIYSMTGICDKVEHSLSILSSLTSNNSHFYYEFPNDIETLRMNAELHDACPFDRLVDMAAKAAYRAQPLGTSVYVPQHTVGSFTADMLNEYMQATRGSQGLVVVGTGIGHEELEEGVAAMGVSGGGVAPAGAGTKYLGGDLRLETGGSTAYVAVVGDGATLGGADALAAEVAKAVLEGGDGVKYGSNASSAIMKLLGDAAGVTCRGVAECYSDAGLLGFAIEAPAAEAPKLVSTLVAGLKKFTASAADVAGAKARVRAEFINDNSKSREVEDIGRQVLMTGNYVEPAETLKALEAVTAAAVNKAIAKAFGGKLTVAAHGNINNVPYSDTL